MFIPRSPYERRPRPREGVAVFALAGSAIAAMVAAIVAWRAKGP